MLESTSSSFQSLLSHFISDKWLFESPFQANSLASYENAEYIMQIYTQTHTHITPINSWKQARTKR